MTDPSALFISGSPGDTRRYRVGHAAEALRREGWRVLTRAYQEEDVPLGPWKVLVLQRVPWSTWTEALVGACRASGALVLFETDDLVFLPEAAERLAHLRGRSDEPSEFADPAAYRQTLLTCDGAIVTTEPLAAAVQALGRPAHVVRNAIDPELLRLSSEAWWAREARRAAAEDDRDPDAPIVIGYASGSATHDADFALCAPAIRQLMHDDQRIVLRLFGPLDPGPGWEPLTERVERVPYMAWRQLPSALAELDISLAPLVLDDPFSAAKSELKFFEAGAVGVPTIASPTPAFRIAITPEVDGLLAADGEGWAAALERLVSDAPARRRMGRAARGTVIARYLSHRRGGTTIAAFDALATDGVGRGMDTGRTLESKTPAHIAATAELKPADIAEMAESAGVAAPIVVSDLPALSQHAMGADYVLADRAAQSAGPIIAEGPWLAAWLAARGRPWIVVKEPVVDPTILYPGLPAHRRPLRIACDLGAIDDPSTRALAVRALAAARALDPALEVLLFHGTPVPGEDSSSAEDSDGPANGPAASTSALKPSLPELDRFTWAGELDRTGRAEVLREAALLLDVRGVNPLPRLAEALACGCPVVGCDVAPLPWREGLDAWIALAPPQADVLGARLAALARDPAKRDRMATVGLIASERWAAGESTRIKDWVAPSDGAVDLATGGPTWDQLQARAERDGPRLEEGAILEQSFVCRTNGLSGVGLRLATTDGSSLQGQLRLSLLEMAGVGDGRQPTPPERTLRETRVALGEAGLEPWTWFHFPAISHCAGRRYVAQWTWHPGDAADEPVSAPALRVLDTDIFAGGRTRWKGEVQTEWTPAFATTSRPRIALRDETEMRWPPAWSAEVDRMRVLTWRAGEDRDHVATMEATWPFRVAETLARWGRPLPPMHERPWPADAATLTKLWRTLRYYGPLALGRELLSFLRWLRLSDNERATVMRRER